MGLIEATCHVAVSTNSNLHSQAFLFGLGDIKLIAVSLGDASRKGVCVFLDFYLCENYF